MENETPLEEGTISKPEKSRSELGELLNGFMNKIITNPVLLFVIKKTLLVIAIIISVVFVFSIFLYIVPGLQELPKGHKYEGYNIEELKSTPEYKKQMLALNKDVLRLSRKFTAFTPGQSYLVINTTDNRFYLYRNKKMIREGFCSSGSYTLLTSSEGSRQWIFKTPKGGFWIQQKITKPLWVRPDWSFVEEGLPIPPADSESRYEFGVLGDYAMSLGDGYLIHGTLYKRFLGMPVTHGCVRLNDEDLEAIFNTLNIGSKVYIF
jgi:lipoprotein-anchoring transpeptidase ErfK/SrfK